MKKNILKTVSPFLFFLLAIGLAVPGTAQQKVKNERQDRINRYQRVNNNTPKKVITRNANYGKNVRAAQRGNNVYASNRNVGTRNYNNRRGVNSRIVYRTRVNRPGVRVYGNPIGFRVGFLPRDVIRFNRGADLFFYSCGDFYIQTRFGYRTIQAPIGAQIKVLPRRAREVRYGRDIFYQVDDVLLTAVVGQKGRVRYEVVGYA